MIVTLYTPPGKRLTDIGKRFNLPGLHRSAHWFPILKRIFWDIGIKGVGQIAFSLAGVHISSFSSLNSFFNFRI